MKDFISVIVPVYKVEKYLPKCLDSIINQTYKNLEIILVDDGSPDNCPKICDEYAKKDKRIRVIHKENGGVSVARNAAISVVKGDYITFVDGDDYIAVDMYEKMINKIKRDNSDVCICGFNKVYDGYTEIVVEENLKDLNYEKLLIGFISNEASKNDNIIYTNNIMGSACRVLYSRETINSHRFIEDLANCEDLLFNLEVLTKDTKISVLSENLYNYIQHATSFVHTTSIKKLEMQLRVVQLIDDFYRDKNLDKEYLQAYKFSIYEFILNEVIRSKDKIIYKYFMHNENIQNLNNKENYKAKQKKTKSRVYKIANFLIHKKFFKLYSFCYNLIKRNK